jgi:ribulose-5-phosphate 4-epimerase/fuculose-1-phosphate aldolase
MGADHTAIFMRNHGVITRGRHLEMAYWRMEIVEAVCHNYLIARDLKGDDKIPRISGEYARMMTKKKQRNIRTVVAYRYGKT